MCLSYILMMFALGFLKYSFCRENTTDLKLSDIENQIEALDNGVKVLNKESAEMKLMILEMNSSCFRGNKLSNNQYEETINTTDTMTSNDSMTNDQVSRLVKCFKDEKAFNNMAIMDLEYTQKDMISKIELLENKTLDLFEKQENNEKGFNNIKEENERNFEKCETQISKAFEQIPKLRTDISSLNNRLTASYLIQHLEQKKIESQHDGILTNIRRLEDNYKHLHESCAKVCDDSWKYNSMIGRCYLFISKRRTWSESVNFCKSKGARLVEIHSRRVLDSLIHTFEETGLDWGEDRWDGFWTGGFKSGSNWRWHSNYQWIGWTNWYPTEPSGGRQDKIVVLINDVQLRWDDKENSRRLPFICEK